MEKFSKIHRDPTQAGTNTRVEEVLREAMRCARRGELDGVLVLAPRVDGEVEYGVCLTPETLKTIAEKLPDVLNNLAKQLNRAAKADRADEN
jgi:hypothetical protein